MLGLCTVALDAVLEQDASPRKQHRSKMIHVWIWHNECIMTCPKVPSLSISLPTDLRQTKNSEHTGISQVQQLLDANRSGKLR